MSDIKALDPPDGPEPAGDLIAVYFRETPAGCQVRLDFLDQAAEVRIDTYIALDFQPGGSASLKDTAGIDVTADIAWDMLVGISARDEISAWEAQPAGVLLKDMRFRLVRDEPQDSLVLSFDCSTLQNVVAKARLQVFTVYSGKGQAQVVDQTLPTRLDSAPIRPGKALFYFYQTFAGRTPAQALKHWDGAHTGPDSARHGLSHLLEAVSRSRIPVILGDLATPQNLGALEYLGQLEQVKDLQAKGLLVLPDVSTISLSPQPLFVLPGEIYAQQLGWSAQVRDNFGLRHDSVLTAQAWPVQVPIGPKYSFWFQTQLANQQIGDVCAWGNYRTICNLHPVAGAAGDDLNAGGLTLPLRKALASLAYAQSDQLLVLGGNFNTSAWGDSGAAVDVFHYINNHPWIEVIGLEGLASLPAQPLQDLQRSALPPTPAQAAPVLLAGLEAGQFQSSQSLASLVLARLQRLPPTPITEAAWQMFYQLLDAPDPKLQRLNTFTLRQLGHLIAAADWAAQPYGAAGCERDLNWDGQNECILASSTTFASFETTGGALVSAFVRTPDGVHQVAGPSYQVASGISDPFRWKPELGLAGDPDAPGAALVEPALAQAVFNVGSSSKTTLTFESQDGLLHKQFTLLPDGLRVDYHLLRPQIIQLQVSQDPWERFNPGWWSASNRRIFATSSLEIQPKSFADSKPFLALPEDPNFDYGAGHYVLFPFVIDTIQGHGDFWIELRFK